MSIQLFTFTSEDLERQFIDVIAAFVQSLPDHGHSEERCARAVAWQRLAALETDDRPNPEPASLTALLFHLDHILRPDISSEQARLEISTRVLHYVRNIVDDAEASLAAALATINVQDETIQRLIIERDNAQKHFEDRSKENQV